MSIELPAPIDLYFTSENTHDPSAIEMCFAADAIVRDEGKTITGVAAIKAWRIESGEKYHHTIEPLSVSALGGKVMGSKRIGLPGNRPEISPLTMTLPPSVETDSGSIV